MASKDRPDPMTDADVDQYTVLCDSDHAVDSQAPGSIAFGFDLGSAYSSVAVWRNGKVEVLQTDSEGSYLIPSHVQFSEETGAMGADLRPKEEQLLSGELLYGAKRLIGRTDTDPVVERATAFLPFLVQTLGLGVKPLLGIMRKGVWRFTTPEEVLAMILLQMKGIAETQTGRVCQNIVLTMPACFTRLQQARLQRACGMAGLNALRIMPEPSPVALIYAQQQQQQQDASSGTNLGSGVEKLALIFNFGAGHCDVAIAATAGGFCQIKAITGDAIGGEDILGLMMKRLVGQNKMPTNARTKEDRQRIGALRVQCMQALLTLSEQTDAEISVPSKIESSKDVEVIKVTRADVDAWSEPVYSRCQELVQQVLTDARLEASNLDDYILVGGSSNIPYIRNMLQKIMGGRPPYALKLKPGQEVAYGAALEAAITSGIKDSEGNLDLLTIQAMPFSLGIGIEGGKLYPVLHRNSTIPHRKDVMVTTSRDNQTEALITVYEGEGQRVQDGHLLGFLLLSGIPPLPKGNPIINVCMDVDAMDTLRVVAGVYVPNQEEPVVQLMEVRMPTVDDGHAWCIEAIDKKYGKSLDVALPLRA